jgi:hypothetical protein
MMTAGGDAAMAISADIRESADQEIEAFCQWWTCLRSCNGVRLTHHWRGNTVTIAEQRLLLREPSRRVNKPVAQFRFVEALDNWTLHWIDTNFRWHSFDETPVARSITSNLVAVDRDPTRLFWGWHDRANGRMSADAGAALVRLEA